METVSADIADREQAVRAVAGSRVVYLLVGLQYDHRVWSEQWPRIMANTIEACKRAGAKLLFFDNVYMYGKVDGPMTEETPFNPCSRKGETRAAIATALIDEWKAGGLTGMIARAADFYGPDARNGVPNVLVFAPFSKKRKASWLVNDAVPHSFTYTVDAAHSIAALAERESAWNQTWHVPTTPNPPTGREFIALCARTFSVAPRYRVLSRPLLRLAGVFVPNVRESYRCFIRARAPICSTRRSSHVHLASPAHHTPTALSRPLQHSGRALRHPRYQVDVRTPTNRQWWRVRDGSREARSPAR